MKIEKVKNYNQKMLAALSTILVIMAAIGLILLAVYLIKELLPYRNQGNNTLLSDDKVEQLKKDSLRSQIISYDSPVLIDTLNQVYLIPVTVNTLRKPEPARALLDVSSGGRRGTWEKNVDMSYYGTFNNLLIYDNRKNVTFRISDKRFIGDDLTFRYLDDDNLITFSGAETDTNKDGVITMDDFKSLFVYSFKENRLRRISYTNSTVLSFERVLPSKDLLITFGVDRNKDNKYDEDSEPQIIMKYSFMADALTPIVNKDLEKELQKIIDKN
jgi:hypothetical protein